MRAWEQNSSSISETSRTVIGDHPNVRAISPGQIRQLEPSSIVALVVLFDLHGRSPPTAMQRLALVFRRCSGTRNSVEGIPVNNHGSFAPEMVFEMARRCNKPCLKTLFK